jgi:hypothetical protein
LTTLADRIDGFGEAVYAAIEPMNGARFMALGSGRGQQSSRAPLVDADSGLGLQIVAAQRTQLYSRAQRPPSSVTAQFCRAMPPPALKHLAKNERSSWVPPWVWCGPMGSR